MNEEPDFPDLAASSGLIDAPPEGGFLPDDPFARAALRQREAVRPAGGRQEGNLGPQMAATAAAGVPVMAVVKAVAAAPKIAAATLAALGLAGSTSAANENQFTWRDANEGRMKRMQWLDQQIELEATRKTPSAKGTQKARMDSLITERDQLRENQKKEYDDAYTAWQEQEGRRIEAERPFREQYPTAYRMLPLAGWGSSALGGLIGAKGGRPVASMIGGALGGIPGSAAAAVGPTAYDAATLPTGSKHQKQAAEWLADPNYWLSRVAPEILTGMGLGATAGKYGSYMRGQKPASKAAPAGQPSAPQPSTPAQVGQSSTSREAALVREYEEMTAKGFVLNEPQSRVYGHLVWFKP